MKTKQTEVKEEKLVRVPEKQLLSLVADKLKNQVLFPEKVECAKNYLKQVNQSAI